MSTLRVNNVTDLGDDAVITDGALAVPTGKILQVVSATKSDNQSTSLGNAGEVTVSGLSCVITPASTTSKIYVTYMLSVSAGLTTFAGSGVRIQRNDSAIAQGDARGARLRLTGAHSPGRGVAQPYSGQFLDAPASTSEITYSLKIVNMTTGTDTFMVNTAEFDNFDPSRNGGYTTLPISTLTVMEVAS